MRILPIIFCLAFSSQLWSQGQVEDWDFTPDDYATLRTSGKALYLAVGSQWLPEAFSNNLLHTLAYALSRPAAERVTDGVNVRDLFHGHIACTTKNPRLVERLEEEATRSTQELLAQALGKWFNPVTAQNLPALIALRPVYEGISRDYVEHLQDLGVCEKFVVIYHSYEYHKPSTPLDSPGDPRRNFVTENETLHTRGFRPPDTRSASSWMQLYQNVLQFSFLIDRTGGVHITIWSTSELSAVVGSPLG